MKLSKTSIPYKALSKLTGLLFFIILFGGASILQTGPIQIILFTTTLAISFSAFLIYEYLYWKNYNYQITQEKFEIKSGVLSKNTRDIPIRRIQNVDVQRNMIQRFLNISKVHIETAGGNSTEADLKYVDYEKAKEIQKEIRELKNRRKTSQETREKEDFKLSTKNLTILSLVSLKPRTLATYFVIIIIAGGFLTNVTNTIPGTGSTFLLTFLATTATAGLWITTAASVFARNYDFKLIFRDNALEYEKGLLQRSSGTIPEEKIQNLIIEENILKRILGYATLKVETAGLSPNQQQLEGSETAIPLAKKQEIQKMAEEIGEYKTPKLEKISPEAKKRYFHRYLILATITAATALTANLFLGITPAIYIIPLAIAAASKTASKHKWKNIAYKLGENHVFTRTGFWNRKTYTVPYFRIQNLMKSQTILQKRWNQNTLTLDTAGSVITNPRIPDMNQKTAQEKLEKTFTKFKKSIQ